MSRLQRNILLVVLVPAFMSLLAVSSINVVLPAIEESLHSTTSQLQWVLAGYTLAFGVLLVAGGRAGDIYGRGKLFVTGLALFGLGSLGSGLAPTANVLDVARVVMGLGSGLLNPQIVGFIQQYFSGHQRARAYATFGSVIGVSVAAGPVMGGVFVLLAGEDWGWRWTFLINAPIAIIAMVAARFLFPTSAWHKPPEKKAKEARENSPELKRKNPDLDPVGTIVFAIAVLLIMLAFMEMDKSLWWLIAAAVGVILLALWVRWERRYKSRDGEPMVDMGLFKIRTFSAGTALIGIYFTGSTSVWVAVALYLQNYHGFTPLQASMIGLPGAILSVFTSQIAGSYVLRLGRKMVVAGIATAMFAMVMCIAIALGNEYFGISPWWLLLSLAIMSGAQGFVVSPNQTLTLAAVPSEQSGTAGGVMQTGQRIGTAVGITGITTIIFTMQYAVNWNWAVITSWGAIGMLMLVACIIAVVDSRRRAE